MARQQFIEEAILRRIQVQKELESLNILLADYDEETANSTKTHLQSDNGLRKQQGYPKGDMSWEDYVVFIVGKLGGKSVTSKAIIKYAIDANPTERPARVADAVRGKVSKLSAEGENKRLDAEKHKNRKLGYLYSLRQDHHENDMKKALFGA